MRIRTGIEKLSHKIHLNNIEILTCARTMLEFLKTEAQLLRRPRIYGAGLD